MSEYIVYADKPTDFECTVEVSGANIKNSTARLVLESSGANLMFVGRMEGSRCIVPISKLKGLLDEQTTGKIKLEVIVEDTFFVPWESDFKVSVSKSVKAEVVQPKVITKAQVKATVVEQKIEEPIVSPVVELTVPTNNEREDGKIDRPKNEPRQQPATNDLYVELADEFKEAGITKENARDHVVLIRKITESFFSNKTLEKSVQKNISKESIKLLMKS